jgi:Response regulators consisting of a CheY-like receiver domain and a winged-helix DNA-binding domain
LCCCLFTNQANDRLGLEPPMRILIIEDEVDFAQALSRGLKNQGYAVDVAKDGKEGWELGTVNPYDLVILDLNLPLIDGLEVCRLLRHRRPDLLILILTARDQIRDRVIGLDMGADDYLVKPFHFEELTARIRALLRRDLRVREPILHVGDLQIDPAERIAWKGKRRLDLTAKEFSILEYLARHKDEIVTSEQLIEHTWGEDEIDPFSASIRVHIHSLRRKLGDKSDSTRYIETIVGQGYRLIASETNLA